MTTDIHVTANLDTEDMQQAIDYLSGGHFFAESVALDNLRSHLRAEDTEAQRVVSTHADPIKPDYPDGLYLWRWDGDYPGKSYVERRNGQWIDFQGKPDHELTPPEDCTRVRVLGDDEIAVRRIWRTETAEGWRAEAKHCATQSAPTLSAAALCHAYADALAEESGDRP